MAIDLSDAGPELLAFRTERHLATPTTLRPDGTPHVVPVGFTDDVAARTARVITSDPSAEATGTSTSPGTRSGLPDEGQPRENPARVAIEITVDRILGSA